ncbi:MAG: M15 family metallopeptidase [Acidimicrobiales bacterium]
MSKPSFDKPTFTVPAETVFAQRAESIPTQTPLPELTRTDSPPIAETSDEALVSVEHRRIRTLANYWHGGWANAIPGTYLRTDAARRLYAAADSLPNRWGLAVFDAWRPLELQQELFDAALDNPGIEPGFMAPVSHDPATPPPHLTGGAVDLTLTFDGTPIGPGTGFDDITDRAHAAALEATLGPAREVRRMLYWAMRRQYFVVFTREWWHFEYGTSRWAANRNKDAKYGPAEPLSDF